MAKKINEIKKFKIGTIKADNLLNMFGISESIKQFGNSGYYDDEYLDWVCEQEASYKECLITRKDAVTIIETALRA